MILGYRVRCFYVRVLPTDFCVRIGSDVRKLNGPILRGVGAVAASALLSGCDLAPGMHLRYHSIKAIPRAVASKVTLERIDFNLPKKHPELFVIQPYRIGAEDILNITVWDHPELTIPAGQYRSAAESGIQVDERGRIFYPFAGTFSVRGLTVDQVRKTLSKRLIKYIRDPQVSVRVASYNSQKVQVLGASKRSVTQQISSIPLSLMEAINKAGGISQSSANAERIFLIRSGKPTPTIYTLDANQPSSLLVAEKFYLKDADIVYVSTAPISNWSKFLSQLVGSTAATYRIVEKAVTD